MSSEERDAFLARAKPMRISCLKPDGTPYIAVCWHDWHDGYFWLVPRQRSRWAEYLEHDGRLAFVVDEGEPSVVFEVLRPARSLTGNKPEVPVVPVVPADRDVRGAVRLQAGDAHRLGAREKGVPFLGRHAADLASPTPL